MSKPWILIYGPTGSGKSDLAVKIAQELTRDTSVVLPGVVRSEQIKTTCAVLSCDSVAVYQDFDIGAAKPSFSERGGIDHYLFDLVRWDESFDAESYARHARQVMSTLWQKGVLPLVVVGTGLYLRALQAERFDQVAGPNMALRRELQGLDSEVLWQRLLGLRPQRAKEIHPHDRVRLIRGIELAESAKDAGETATKEPTRDPWPEPLLTLALDPPRAVLHERIALRTLKMLEKGLEQEVQNLLDAGVDPRCKPMQSIGYKQICEILLGQMTREGLEERIKAATRQYAKRQCTWFKKLPRDITLPDGSVFLSDVLAEVQKRIKTLQAGGV